VMALMVTPQQVPQVYATPPLDESPSETVG
jgi:hypothetical protein